MSNASIMPPGRNSTGWSKYFPFEARTWKKTIADSGLPDEAKELIHRVIKKSRLMRFEKIEVIQELIGHFQDGNLAGKDFSQIIANFGDPDVTAKLVRRSKIRNRPIMLKSLQIFGWMLLGVASAWFAVYAYFQAGVPSPTTDYLAEFNSLQTSVGDDDRAWPIYRPMWSKYSFSEGGDFHRPHHFTSHNDEEGKYERLVAPGDSEWPAAVAKLEELSDLLDAFRTGSQKQRFGLVVQADVSKYSPEDFQALFPNQNLEDVVNRNSYDVAEIETSMQGAIINILLPHLQPLRTAARIMAVDTRWAVEQNDSQRAVENLETFWGLASHAADHNSLIGSLVAYSIAGIGFNELEETMLRHPDFFSKQQLAQIQKRIANISFTELTRIEGERAYQMDLVQRIYSDDGKGDGRITPIGTEILTKYLPGMASQRGLLMETGDPYADRIISVAREAVAPASMFVLATRKQTVEKIEEFTEAYAVAAKQPYWNRDMPDYEEFLQENETKHMFLSFLMPAFDSVIHASDRLNARHEGVLTGIALQRYFLEHGKWPGSLVELSPEFLAEIPTDIVTGNEMLLSFDEQGPIVYSVGNDLDDDGGVRTIAKEWGRGRHMRAAANWYPSSVEQARNGDWIVWPQTRFPMEEIVDDEMQGETE